MSNNRTRWVIGWNVPGYLPDADPVEFDIHQEACAALIDELHLEAGQCEDTADRLAAEGRFVDLQIAARRGAEQATAVADAVALLANNTEGTWLASGLAWWIVPLVVAE